ncbi:hypothetical protein EMPS_08719 [Entomortierella parvispora]|uniref:Copper acquisition factor BIM1-like domain-containing protein n=1 Tax=Entomortierella parvispora TaxID=205924 RepID=A0A9P3LZW4_9FUNG|nr:hypothetical protein EMPS_08719 [Entomortierella parvispora]
MHLGSPLDTNLRAERNPIGLRMCPPPFSVTLAELSRLKGLLEINSHHPSAKIQINLILSPSSTPADFTAAASSPASSTSLNHPGHACLPFDLSSSQGAVNNVNATIQVIYKGESNVQMLYLSQLHQNLINQSA